MSEGLGDEGEAVELRAEELRLVAIRRRATQLAVALTEPFSVDTHARLRSYVERDADEAQVLVREVLALPPARLRERIAELTRSKAVRGEVKA
ncbi:hypothetical protein EYS09_11920 [Streptomyces kasugaensis]|uniref:Uncharacterized protein n=1 Tax=Streptomyces kasugaensis TaxID=1946 RepID=A0A4Q9HWB8_STRKA|nr:hypothetical protein [Streptomyces kasugaensis]TBO59452.1 hypothetical protein EYS09_11920 [Streptomyces kasugaensis]